MCHPSLSVLPQPYNPTPPQCTRPFFHSLDTRGFCTYLPSSRVHFPLLIPVVLHILSKHPPSLNSLMSSILPMTCHSISLLNALITVVTLYLLVTHTVREISHAWWVLVFHSPSWFMLQACVPSGVPSGNACYPASYFSLQINKLKFEFIKQLVNFD